MSLFYRDGKICFSSIPPIREGVMIKMVGASTDRFFTRHGFIYPLNALGPSLESLLESRPLFGHKFKTHTTASFLVVDRFDAVWQADVYLEDGNEYTVDVHSLPQGMGVSWAMDDNEFNRDVAAAILMAGLSDEETIIQFSEQGISNGSEYTVMNIADIAARLRNEFPLEVLATCV